MKATHRRLLGTALSLALASLAACEDTSGSDVLAAPTGLTVTAASPSSLLVTFNAVSRATGYEIARANGGAFAVLDTIAAPPFTDTGLEPQTSYTYRVTALRSTERSPEVQAAGTTAQRGVVTVGAHVTTSRTFFRDSVYRLTSFVQVANGATLTIQDGTRIEGDPGSALFITRGARIEASGTAAKPIVFTSSQPVGQRRAGDWGGLIIIGNGSINRTAAGGIQLEGTGTGASNPAQFYGVNGTAGNNADNSGTLRYVRIEFAGFGPAANQELNSLTLAGVGSGTTLDHVQTFYGLDDSFEWFGGAVDGKYLVSYEAGDDHFDASEGYVGRNQFLIAFQSVIPAVRAGSGAVSSDPQGFEVDGCADSSAGTCGAAGENAAPLTIPVFANFTLAGPGTTAGFPSGGGIGMVIRRGAGGHYVNGVVTRWPTAALSFRDESTTGTRITEGNLTVGNVLVAENGTTYHGGSGRFTPASGVTGIDASAATAASLFTAFPAATATSTTAAAFDWAPAAGSPAATGGSGAFTGSLQTRAGAFVTATPYRGAAASAGEKWWQAWTTYSRDQ